MRWWEAVKAACIGAAMFFAELVRLMLVLAAATLGGQLFGHPTGVLAALLFLLVYALYTLFVIVAARDLVQGWLGMLAGRVPNGFEDRPENLGRALAGLLFACGWVGVLFATHRDRSGGREAEALIFAFALLACLVFGAGTAVPRLWFVARRASRPVAGADAVPELLQEAGKRASRFFYCAFLGIGLGLVGAQVRGATPPPVAVLPAASEPGPTLHGDFLSIDALCRPATERCRLERHLTFVPDRDGQAAISLFAADRDPPMCVVRLDGTGAADALDEALNGTRADELRKAALAVVAARPVGLRVSLPEGQDRCQYILQVKQPEAP